MIKSSLLNKIHLLTMLIAFSNCREDSKKKVYLYYEGWKEGKPVTFYTENSENSLIDTSTFFVFPIETYAKDNNNAFYLGHKIKGADAKTFKELGGHFAKDKNVGYFGNEPIDGSCGSTFKVLNETLSTDGYEVFYTTEPLHVVCIDSFRIVKVNGVENWTTDRKYFYYNNFKIPTEDVENFVFFDCGAGVSKNKHWVYYKNHILNFDFDGKKLIDTIDAGTFEMISSRIGRDKFGCIDIFKGRVDCIQFKTHD